MHLQLNWKYQSQKSLAEINTDLFLLDTYLVLPSPSSLPLPVPCESLPQSASGANIRSTSTPSLLGVFQSITWSVCLLHTPQIHQCPSWKQTWTMLCVCVWPAAVHPGPPPALAQSWVLGGEGAEGHGCLKQPSVSGQGHGTPGGRSSPSPSGAAPHPVPAAAGPGLAPGGLPPASLSQWGLEISPGGSACTRPWFLFPLPAEPVLTTGSSWLPWHF